MGSLCFMCDLYSHSETAHGKSLWIHQKEQKNYPWRFLNQVVEFRLGLSNHKSSLTNPVDEKSKPRNRSTCWAHFCGVALKLLQGTYQIQCTWHQTWLTFEVNSGYILLVFALHTHQFDFFKCRMVFCRGIAVYEAEERAQASHTFCCLQYPCWIKFPAKYHQDNLSGNPTRTNYPLGYLGQKVSVTATNKT